MLDLSCIVRHKGMNHGQCNGGFGVDKTERISLRIERELRRKIADIIRLDRNAGGEMNESVFIRTALRRHVQRENDRLRQLGGDIKEENES